MDAETGEVHDLEPEFVLMSRGGKKGKGIAGDWYAKYMSDTNKDYIYVNRTRMSLPKYYDYLREKIDSQSLEEVKKARKQSMMDNKHEYSKNRLKQKETVKKQQLSQLKRGLENVR